MKTAAAWIAWAAIRQPSISRCGTRRMISRSLNAPGSDSSALTTTYAGPERLSDGGTSVSFRPMGKPAPPRPRNEASVISSITSAGSIPRARSSDSYPPIAWYSSSRVRSCSSAPWRTVSSAATHLLDEPGDVLGLRRLPVPVVDDHDRRVAAAAGALDEPERHLAVIRGLAGWDPELLFEGVDDVLRPNEGAGEVGAHLDDVPSDRLEVVHVVEGGDRLDLGRREVHRVGDLAQRLRREPTSMAFLREAQRAHDGRAPLRIPLPQPVDLRDEVAHLSTSPMTVSNEPTIAIRSATSASRMHVAVASSATNDGARNFTRHGLGPPSETT